MNHRTETLLAWMFTIIIVVLSVWSVRNLPDLEDLPLEPERVAQASP